ncbi:hypothetical protein [uncultured Polaribacter sp.]|uniref:hypothetical protein n=1 Tax=uncultured Polaribacter sp. TaxID=174711 RepID=UPI002617DD41|nr:hypothetical protein [uncultured Polaribacter sp.]
MKNITHLINYYLTTKEVYSLEQILNDLVISTNQENYLEIISKLEEHPYSTEVETSIYLTEISKKNLKGLKSIIKIKQKNYTNKTALEYLEEALINIKS